MGSPWKRWMRASTGERHFGHDETVVGARLEGDAPVHAVHDDLLEELDRGLFILKDRGRLRVERLALLRVERIARLLHQIVEALARLAADPVFSVEARRVEDAPEAAIRVEERRLRVSKEEAPGRHCALVVHAVASA